jgi:signal transduction histidine kinase
MITFLLRLALGGFNILKIIGRAIGSIAQSLNAQGWIGLGVSLVLGWYALGQHGEARHWKKQSGQFETLYHNNQAAFATTVANYRAAAEKARALDAANADRVRSEQTAINERTSHDFETRIAAARAAAERLQREAAAHPGRGGNPSMPSVSASPSGIAQAAGQNELSPSDALTATEQAIQLDELISWARSQHAVDPNKAPPHG